MSREYFSLLYPDLKKHLAWYIINSLCRCVGTGRRGGLKIHCQQWRAGSIPATGTTVSGQSALRSVSGSSRRLMPKTALRFLAPPFKIATTMLGCDFVFWGHPFCFVCSSFQIRSWGFGFVFFCKVRFAPLLVRRKLRVVGRLLGREAVQYALISTARGEAHENGNS